jgi:hypothetical protein
MLCNELAQRSGFVYERIRHGALQLWLWYKLRLSGVWSSALLYIMHSNSAELNRTFMFQDKHFVPRICYYVAVDLLLNSVLARDTW